ncbi:MAG TPA: S41 family peptidase [Kofleriaceae bacterium]|nr:S41 family peptidase [Kofleriaceae bacterium]
MIALCLAGCARAAIPHDPQPTADQRVAELDWLLDRIAHDDPYAGRLDVAGIRAHYLARARAATTRDQWIGVLEDVLGELYDHHVSLGTNTAASPRLVPTGADMWGEVVGERALITEIRRGTAAERAGLRAGMVVTAIGGRPIADAIAARRPAVTGRDDPEAASWAFRVLLAGTHDQPRRLTACAAPDACHDYTLDAPELADAGQPVTSRLIGDRGYIRIENSLGDSDTVAAFDAALQALAPARVVILDLRNTPSGGSTEVAEPILGRFVDVPRDYQRIFVPGHDRAPWNKAVAPRAPLDARPLIVLVDHWTGSMGEGMAIGLAAMKRATVIGTRMAGLRGGIAEVTLPRSGITVRFQNEQLFHIDGTPRERWVPPVLVEPTGGEPDDPILARGLRAAHDE